MKYFSLIVLFLVLALPSFACKCAIQGWQSSVKNAYDVIVGEVIDEREGQFECGRHFNSYEYIVKIDFSYQSKVADTIIVHGGKGGGDCGARFNPGNEYVIFLYACDGKFFTYRCDDNSWLPYAKKQIAFLNGYYEQNYQPGPPWKIIIFLAINSFPAFISMFISWNAFTHRRINIKIKKRWSRFFNITLLTALFLYSVLCILWFWLFSQI